MIRLKELREERGWKKADAARFLGKKYMTYVHHENGEREPDSEDLKAYAKAYGVSIDYLVGRTNEKSPITSSDEGYENLFVSDKDKQLIEWFRSLPQEKQKAILVSQDAPEELL